MEIESLGLVAYTDLKGEADSGKLKRGIYNIRVSAPGFATQLLENVEVKLGKAVRIDIELVPVAMELSKVA